MSLPLVEIEWRDCTAESPRRQTLRRPKKNETAAMRENSVILYPNPARDEIKLKHSYRDVSSLRIEIYDYAGRKLGTVQCTNCMQEVSMQVADFASGLYTYKVIINDNSVSNGKISIIK